MIVLYLNFYPIIIIISFLLATLMHFVYYAGFYLTILAFMYNLNGPNLYYYVSYFFNNAIKHTTIFARKVFFLPEDTDSF
jgi:hypothetical protein